MAHFAKIQNGIVTQVVVVDNAQESRGEEYLNILGLEGKWVQTSYSGAFGRKFAGIGDTYVASTEIFKPAKPFTSWKFDENKWAWFAPKPYPLDENPYKWDEDLKDWVEVI